MVKELGNWVSVSIILDRLTKHPLLTDVTLEQVVGYLVDFIGIVGFSQLYFDRVDIIEIHNYRGVTPCNIVSVNQVRDTRNNIALRSSTDVFYNSPNVRQQDTIDRMDRRVDATFKTQGDIIYTSFKEGRVEVSYKTIHVDNDGYPMVPENSIFLKCFENYVKMEVFNILFDMGKISPSVLQNAQQNYAWTAGQLNQEFTQPSMSEMESISNSLNQMIVKNNLFTKTFKSLGSKEYLKDQR